MKIHLLATEEEEKLFKLFTVKITRSYRCLKKKIGIELLEEADWWAGRPVGRGYSFGSLVSLK